MKKIILFVLGVFLMLFPSLVTHASSDAFLTWTLDKSIYVYLKANNTELITNLVKTTVNGNRVYCIEPGAPLEKDSYFNATYDVNDTIAKNKDIKKISLIGYYGYGYKNHNSEEYYMAAQELIWRESGASDVYFAENNNRTHLYDLTPYKNEILNLVSKHDIVPSFAFKDDYLIGDEITLSDQNGVLEDYEVKDGNASINCDSITIKIGESNDFTLQRKSDGRVTQFYYKTGYQTTARFGLSYNVQNSYQVPSSYGKIVLKKFDDKTKENVPETSYASLEGAKYALYDEALNLIEEKSTDEKGTITFDHLSKGNYTIKEVSPSKGYQKDEQEYHISLNHNNKIAVVNSYEKLAIGRVDIYKFYKEDDEKEAIPESAITFDVYNKNNSLYGSYTTNQKGMTSFDLPYGEYLIKQKNSPLNVTKVDDFTINIDEHNTKKWYTLINHKKEVKILPKTGKNLNDYLLILFLLFLSLIGYRHAKRTF